VPGAETASPVEGDSDSVRQMGKDRDAPGGVYDHGTQEEDDPETREARASPR